MILGNPPYSGHSANKNEWTEKLLKEDVDGATSYYKVDGEPLGEKNPKWLQDDYVKFLRFAQWKIHKAGQGIVGMITNHSYLDNPTFRGMRQSLMNTFNEIYIIDLHGNSLKKETSPDGGSDENVFDIRQGTAIAVFVKSKISKVQKIYHRDMFGLREEKYDWLGKKAFRIKDYETLRPTTPWYFFTKTNTKEIEHYTKWQGVNEIFPVNSVGIVTARDSLTIKWSASEVRKTVNLFAKMEVELARQTYVLGQDARDWKVSLAQQDLIKTDLAPERICQVLYRPFDTRFTYYTGNSRGFHCMPRNEVMRHMLRENLALVMPRRVETAVPWSHIFASENIVEHVAVSLKTIDYCFPLYLYDAYQKKKGIPLQTMMLFEPEVEYGKAKGKKANIAVEIFEQLKKAFGKVPTPEQIFGYCYAVLYSNLYREKYAEFLRIDFPRIPFTKSYELFKEMSELGADLIELHLLKHKSLNNPILKYRGKGNEDAIERPMYDETKDIVRINGHRYFENVTPEVWNYQIGGYQVMEKYLKDRKGRQMDDPSHYCKMGTSIAKTIELQKEIDKIFPKIEKKVLEMGS